LSEVLGILCPNAALVQFAVNKRGILRGIFWDVSPGRDLTTLLLRGNLGDFPRFQNGRFSWRGSAALAIFNILEPIV